MTLPFDHTCDLDLGVSRSESEIALSQEWGGWLTMNEKDVSHPFMTMILTCVTMVRWADVPDSDWGDFRRRCAVDISSYFMWCLHFCLRSTSSGIMFIYRYFMLLKYDQLNIIEYWGANFCCLVLWYISDMQLKTQRFEYSKCTTIHYNFKHIAVVHFRHLWKWNESVVNSWELDNKTNFWLAWLVKYTVRYSQLTVIFSHSFWLAVSCAVSQSEAM